MAFDDAGDLKWTRPLTYSVAALSMLVGAAAVLLRHELGPDAAMRVGVLGAVGLFVATSGRLITLYRARWHTITAPPAVSVRVRRGRVVIRRWPADTLLAFAAVAPFAPLALWLGVPPLFWAFFGPILVAFGLPSFASRVVVGPTEVVVASTFAVTVVPRGLVEGVTGTGRGRLKLQLAGHPPVEIGVGVHGMAMRSWDYRGAELKTAGRIWSALDSVPAVPSSVAAVRKRRRWLLVAVCVLAAADFLTLAVLVMAGVIGQ
ncbi:hypothetical protein [Dactylosporangium sp. CS-033363]|uniref:hypothetical protein n=1 Tax=Dactylosporangium sp. CS-033363 TaxID=3239935 RepID=UPI003D913338